MATATAKAPRKVKPATGTARLTLTINGTDYRLRPIPDESFHAWELRKADGTAYHVRAEGSPYHACDCGDFTWRREGRDHDGCKHVKALRALDLI